MMINPLNTGAGEAFVRYSTEQNDYGERKLLHYNKWLKENFMNSKPYPGFPEDAELLMEIGEANG